MVLMTQFALLRLISVEQQVLICGCRFPVHLSVDKIRLTAGIKDGSQLQVLEPEGRSGY